MNLKVLTSSYLSDLKTKQKQNLQIYWDQQDPGQKASH